MHLSRMWRPSFADNRAMRQKILLRRMSQQISQPHQPQLEGRRAKHGKQASEKLQHSSGYLGARLPCHGYRDPRSTRLQKRTRYVFKKGKLQICLYLLRFRISQGRQNDLWPAQTPPKVRIENSCLLSVIFLHQ